MFGINRMKRSFFIKAMERLKLIRQSWLITGMNESWKILHEYGQAFAFDNGRRRETG